MILTCFFHLHHRYLRQSLSLPTFWKLNSPHPEYFDKARLFPGYSLLRSINSYADALPSTDPIQIAYNKATNAINSIQVPFQWPDKKRFEHTQIVGGSGSGKTTLLSHLILHDIHKPNPPCIILIDPKNLVIPKLSKLAFFDPDNGPLKDRLIVVSPEYKPAINIFDNTGRSTAGAIDNSLLRCPRPS